jgi:ribonuclease D
MRADCTVRPQPALQTIIAQPAEFSRLAARLEGAAAIALDTEFLRERTYRAELCLLQLADASGPVCIDPLALPDLTALAGTLAGGRAPKVMHASRQDIEVLLPAVGLVQPVFDTQIAAALAGLPAQIGYADLVRRLLGHELPKAHTRTDWSRRPLSPEQISYALDDVRYLLPLQAQLQARLAELGRSEWLREELAALADEASYAVEPEQAWTRIRGLRGLDPQRVQLARALAAWRERRARERNRPRGWILEDAVLREIIMGVPRTATELARIPGMPAAVVRNCGSELLDVVRSAPVTHEPASPALRGRADSGRSALLKRLSEVHQGIAAALALSPEVLVTRRELELLADGRRDLPVLNGWRRAIIGDRLLAVV